MLQVLLSSVGENITEQGYIGGYPDKEPIYVKVRLEDKGEEAVFPVSRYLMMSVFKSWVFGKLNLSIREYELMNEKDEKIGPGSTFHSLDLKENSVIRIVR